MTTGNMVIAESTGGGPLQRVKIAHMQRLIDEGRASGIGSASMADIRARALGRAEQQK